MKSTTDNIKNLWFGADTPIRQNKIKLHPELWAVCKQVNQGFKPPSGALQIEHYRKSDRLAFANAVLKELKFSQLVTDPKKYLSDINAPRRKHAIPNR